jgi:ribonuclease HII
MKPRPTFSEERRLWKNGYDFVIGVDEVGRGAFAGPVTVGAVVFGNFDNKTPYIRSLLQEINDSKLLRPRKREELSPQIKKHALYWSVESIGVPIINKLGIGKATRMAFRKVIQKVVKILFEKCHSEHFGFAQCKLRRGIPCNPMSVERDHLSTRSSDLVGMTSGTFQAVSNIFLLVDGFHIRYVRGIGLKNQKAIIKGDQKSTSIAAASIIAKVHRDNLMRRLHRQFPVYNFAKNKGYGTKEHQQAIKNYGLSKTHRKSFSLSNFSTR